METWLEPFQMLVDSGIIGGGNAPKEVVKANIDRVKQITDKPFGVNIMLLSPFADDIRRPRYRRGC